MEKKTIYKYTREDGGITVSPVYHEGATEQFRIIADQGKVLVDKETSETGYVFDTVNPDNFEEADDPDAEDVYETAAKILMGEEI